MKPSLGHLVLLLHPAVQVTSTGHQCAPVAAGHHAQRALSLHDAQYSEACTGALEKAPAQTLGAAACRQGHSVGCLLPAGQVMSPALGSQ